jgi:DNA-directed RNA polymerase specialized sigma24 family protein
MAQDEVLATIHERLLKSWTYRVGADMAHDIAQDTWIALRTRYSHIEDETELVKLSFKISQYIYWDKKKQGTREVPPPAIFDPPGGGLSPERQTLMEQVRGAFKTLTGHCTEVMELLLRGYTASEIKLIMGAPRVGTVHVWIHRCTQGLREKLGMGGKK